MPTFEIPVVGAVDFPNNADGYWDFELPMRDDYGAFVLSVIMK